MPASGEDMWSTWLRGQRFSGGEREARTKAEIHEYREAVLDHADLDRADTVLDVGTGDGLIGFGALERLGPDGRVIFCDISEPLLERAREAAADAGVLGRCEFVRASAPSLAPIADACVDAVTFRSVLVYVEDKERVFRECERVLKPGGRLSLFEPIHDFVTTIRPLTDTFLGYDLTRIDHEIPPGVRGLAEKLETYRREHGPTHIAATDFDERDLFAYAESAGFEDVNLELSAWNTVTWETQEWQAWLDSAPAPGIPTKREAIEEALTASEREAFVRHARPLVEGRTPADVSGASAYVWATCAEG